MSVRGSCRRAPDSAANITQLQAVRSQVPPLSKGRRHRAGQRPSTCPQLVLKTKRFGPEVRPAPLLFDQLAMRVSPDQSRRHAAEGNIVHSGQSDIRGECFLESAHVVKIPPETKQGAGSNRRIGGFCKLVEHVDGGGAGLPTELEILPSDEGGGGGLGQRRDHGKIGQALTRRRLHAAIMERHNDRFVSPRAQSVPTSSRKSERQIARGSWPDRGRCPGQASDDATIGKRS